MNGTHSQKRRNGNMVCIHIAIGQNYVVVALINRTLRIFAEFIEGCFQVSAEKDRQFNSIESLITDITKYVESGISQYRMWQAHHLAVRCIRTENTCTHTSYVLRKTHHEFLAYRVDSRVGNLCKLLTEIIEEHLRTFAQHCQRGVITHRSGRFLTVHSHRHDGSVNIFFSISEEHFLNQQVADGVLGMTAALEGFQLNTTRSQPFFIWMFTGELFLYLTIIIYLTFLSIYKKNLTRLQSSLLNHLSRGDVHHTHFAGHNHRTTTSDGISCRAQAVTVEHTSCIASVAEQQSCRSVPWFHQNRVVFIEGFQIFRYRVAVIPRFRNEHTHRLRKRQT